jgi:hypothetical protein
MAFLEEIDFPLGVIGPRDLAPLRRAASAWAGVVLRLGCGADSGTAVEMGTDLDIKRDAPGSILGEEDCEWRSGLGLCR